ncbi:MAG: ferrous iron transport protein B [Candidatus Promineifilaceae bacterium]|jgi:ferrous iron transport protein B
MACIKEILPEPVSATPRKKRKTGKRPLNIALVGNPNAGKTALFNRLTGLRARTGNFPGTTVERHVGRFDIGDHSVEVVDLPGMYSMTPATPEEHVGHDMLFGKIPGVARPDGIVFIIDADNLERNLFLLSQVREFDFPVIVALNMIDVAARHGIQIDTERLSVELGCPVVSIIAKTGTGLDTLKLAIRSWIPAQPRTVIPLVVADAALDDCACAGCCGCAFKKRFDYTEKIADRCSQHPAVASPRRTEAIDRILTNTFTGVPAFFGVMLAVFYLIFSAASIPMELIDGLFANIGGWITNTLPDGALRSLLVEGIIGGVGGILVFLPQICILFFFLGLLEDTGYLPRAAFVMDRLMRRVGLPGSAFVPLLTSHACAIPGIMATRVISDERDRLVTILIAPLMTCSARLPVYAMVTALIFPDEPLKAALVFTGAYALGIVAALTMAFVFKKTILPGESKPIILELPGYKVPCLRSAFLHTFDRAKIFVQQAGTMILLISVVLWAAATYPKPGNAPEVDQLQQQVALASAAGNMTEAKTLSSQASNLQHQFELEYSVAGRLGKFIEPVVRPLGFDWQIGIGVLTSFAAREVIVSTLSIVYGVGADAGEENPEGLYDTLRKATRADGSAVFTTATGLSLLVFYVLAMQCLPTQIVTKRETGSWKWAIFQLVYMTVLAYGASFATYQGLRLLGIG